MIEEQLYITYGYYSSHIREDCEPTGRWRIDTEYSGDIITDTYIYLEVIWYKKFNWYLTYKFPFFKKQSIKEKHVDWVNENNLESYTKYNRKEGEIEECNNEN